MARTKVSTIKKKKKVLPSEIFEKDKVAEEVTYTDFIRGISKPVKTNIELFGIKLHSEDLNLLVDKLNEIISYINNE